MQEHSRALLNLTEMPYMKAETWKATSVVLLKLAINLHDHATFLEKWNESEKVRQAANRDFTFRSKDAFTVIHSAMSLKPTKYARYKPLNDVPC